MQQTAGDSESDWDFGSISEAWWQQHTLQPLHHNQLGRWEAKNCNFGENLVERTIIASMSNA
jgi:hypothetical protein